MHIITENNLEIVVAYRLPPIYKILSCTYMYVYRILLGMVSAICQCALRETSHGQNQSQVSWFFQVGRLVPRSPKTNLKID